MVWADEQYVRVALVSNPNAPMISPDPFNLRITSLPFQPICVIFTQPERSNHMCCTGSPSATIVCLRKKRFSRAVDTMLAQSDGEISENNGNP
jgi:hypothetical protein